MIHSFKISATYSLVWLIKQNFPPCWLSEFTFQLRITCTDAEWLFGICYSHRIWSIWKRSTCTLRCEWFSYIIFFIGVKYPHNPGVHAILCVEACFCVTSILRNWEICVIWTLEWLNDKKFEAKTCGCWGILKEWGAWMLTGDEVYKDGLEHSISVTASNAFSQNEYRKL